MPDLNSSPVPRNQSPIPRLIDTHAHFESLAQAEQQMKQAASRGVQKVLAVGSDYQSSVLAVEIAENISDIRACVGIHPHEAEKDKTLLSKLKKLAASDFVAAIGEAGLDYHYDHSPRNLQKEVFAAQITIASLVNKPLVIHSREAMADTLDILNKGPVPEAGCVMHCFSGTPEDAEVLLKLGCYIAFGGVVTFKNTTAAEVVKSVPLDRLLLETDSPYLSPEPFRGKKNNPSNVTFVAQKIAALKEVSVEEVAAKTTENASKIFGF